MTRLVGLLFIAAVSAASAAMAVAETPRGFRVDHLVVEGNTVLEPAEIARVTAAHEGRPQLLGDLRAAARELEAVYHARGFFLAQVIVPEQDIQNRVARLQVIQGKLGRITVEGNRHYRTEFIRKFFAHAVPDGVPSKRRIEAAVIALNQLLDLKVTTVFTGGQTPGTSDLVVKVEDHRPLHAGLEYDNFGNRLVGQNRAGVSFTGGNALEQGDVLALHTLIPFPSVSNPFYQAEYSRPIDASGKRLGFQFASAATTVGQELQVLDIRGNADIYGANVLFPLQMTPDETSSLSVGLVSKTVQNFVFGATALSKDELRLVEVAYAGNVLSRYGRTLHVETLTQGLGSAFGGTPNGSPLASRPGAGDTFTRLTSDLNQLVPLGPDQLILAHLAFQAADVPLTVAEQFALGGPYSVRGYRQTEFLGDRGYAAGVEYRRNVLQRRNALLQGVAFLDHGYASLVRPAPGEARTQYRTGAGVGLRATLDRTTSVRLDLGFPISPSRSIEGEKSTLYAQVGKTF